MAFHQKESVSYLQLLFLNLDEGFFECKSYKIYFQKVGWLFKMFELNGHFYCRGLVVLEVIQA